MITGIDGFEHWQGYVMVLLELELGSCISRSKARFFL